jgi:hypothetical protein
MRNNGKTCEIAALSAAMIVLGIPLGCNTGPPKPADPAAAREALDRALGAWREGQSAESLKSGDPPIVVSDHVWNRGARLLKYQIEPGDRRAGADQSFQVVLWLQDDKSKGKAKERQEKTEYHVGTNSILTVVRPYLLDICPTAFNPLEKRGRTYVSEG